MTRSWLMITGTGAAIALSGCSVSTTTNNAAAADSANIAEAANGAAAMNAGAEATASANGAAPANAGDPVASAMSAAPASIAHAAAIVTANPDGSMKQLRSGTNGWTCMPDSPATPGPDPMCMDANAAKWATAWIGHKPPPETAGVMYMLNGGSDASNTDPYAKAPTAGSDWVHTGPHIMIVGSPSVLSGYPSGAGIDSKAPYVMWAGTPYAHLMVPVS